MAKPDEFKVHTELNSCPFCGAPVEAHYREGSCVYGTNYEYWIECTNCEYHSGHEQQLDIIVRKHNSLAKESKR